MTAIARQKSAASRGGSSPVFLVGAWPPPLHGQSAVNSAVGHALGARCTMVSIDMSAGRLKRSASYYARRMRSALAGLLCLARHPADSAATLYLSVDSGFGLLFNLGFALLARQRRWRLFLHHHSFAYIERRSRLMSLLITAAGRGATHIHLGDLMRARFMARYPAAAQGIVCSNAWFAGSPRAREPRCTGTLCVGLLSNLTAEKGLHDFLGLLRTAKGAGLPIRGVLAGPPVTATDAAAVAAAKDELGALLDVRGPVQDAEKEAFFRDIDVFLFPTRYAIEAYALVVVEALARHIPVIAYARGCIGTYLVEPGGYAVPPAEDFVAAALARLRLWLADPEAYEAARDGALRLSQSLHRQSQAEFAALLDALAGPVPQLATAA